jgi:SAM-dependent MidA family methyltransferase
MPVRSEPPSSHGGRAGPGRALLLPARIAETIRREGPMTFARFMDAALYDPDEGFYSHPRVGEAADFVTSPHVSPVFGSLLARQVLEFREVLGRPDPFDVVEVGAGDGTLATDILRALPEDVRSGVRYTGVERSAAARARLEGRAPGALASLDQVEPAPAGCVLANELLDSLPFHRLRRTEGGLVELYVGLDGERLELVEGPLSDPALEAHGAGLRTGAEAPASLEARGFVDRCARLFHRGFVWLADYGAEPDEDPSDQLVHGYRGHRVTADVLAAPGSRDITAGVDFGRLVDRARELGLRAWGPVRQGAALLALGFRGLEAGARSQQRAALDQRRGIDALRIYSARTRANLLLARPGLGDLLVLCLGIGVDDPPPSVERALALNATAESKGT